MKNKYDLSDVKDKIKTETVQEISKQKGCSISLIHHYLKKNNIETPKIDLSNKKFNMIKVLGFSHIKKQAKYWKCVCDCGKEIFLCTQEVNKASAISCGCYKKSKEFSRKNKLWNGHEDIHIKWWNNCIRGAKRRNLNFSFTIEYAWNLYLKQNKKCALSNLDISFSKTTRGWQYGETTASMDRINPKMGYVEGNIQWVHKDINFMKNDYDQKYFLNIVKLIYEHKLQ